MPGLSFSRLSPRRQQLLLGLGAVASVVFAVLVALLRVTTLDALGGVHLGAAEWAMADFKDVVYYPAYAFMNGDNPYDTETYLARYPAPFGFYLYPPILLILARPFAALPIDWAIGLQAGLTVALAGLLAFVSLRLSGARGRLPGVLFITALILMSRPGQWNLLLGQVTLPVVLASYAALALAPRRDFLSGCALALCLIKPNFGAPLAVAMLARGHHRAVVTGVVLIVVVNIPLIAMLADKAGGLVPLLAHMGGEGEPLTHVDRLHTQLNYHRVDVVVLASNLLAPYPLGLVGTVLLGGLVMGLVVLGLRVEQRRGRALPGGSSSLPLSPAAGGLIWSGIVLCGYHLIYDLLLLTWPFVALVIRIRATGRGTPLAGWLALGCFLVLAGNYLASTTVMEVLQSRPLLSLVLACANGVAVLGLFCHYLHEVVRARPGNGADRTAEPARTVDRSSGLETAAAMRQR